MDSALASIETSQWNLVALARLLPFFMVSIKAH